MMLSYMVGRFKKLVQNKRLLYGAAAVLALLLGWALFSPEGNGEKIFVVEPGEFLQEVSVSGKVVAADRVDLAFSETGRIGSISVEVGDGVRRGQTLATLALDTLLADLNAAQIDLAEIQKEQDALVNSAYRTLLTDDLAAVPSSSYGVTAPVITGLYQGGEGTYRARVVKEENSDDYELRTFNLEQTGPLTIQDDEPTALGTRGLYISFPDAMSSYDDTTWEISIPNNKSASYRENYNAYQEALRGREKAVANARAEIENIRTDMAQRSLRAPFTGVVTAVEGEVGAIVSSNETVLSLIGEETLQIESFVPEINLSLVRVGTEAVVTLDAYGSEVPFLAMVVSVDPAETIRDGVSTYRAVLQFKELDERIRSGLTANVRITADRRDGVIAVPQGAVTTRDGKKYVRVKAGEESVEREVSVGALSSIGSLEITSGLSPGDAVILPE